MEGVRIVVARFCLDADEHVTPVELRGFVGHAFARISEFHHHSEHSYHYPLVQYKKLGDDLAVVGIGKFARIVLQKMSELCLLYTSPSPRDRTRSRMPSSA